MQPKDPHRLQDSLAFLVQPLVPLSAVRCMLWLRENRTSDLQCWLGTVDGRAWSQIEAEQDWLETQEARKWLETEGAQHWLDTQGGRELLETEGAQH